MEGLLTGLLQVWRTGEREKEAISLDDLLGSTSSANNPYESSYMPYSTQQGQNAGEVDYASAVYAGMQSAGVSSTDIAGSKEARKESGGSKYVEYTEQLHYNRISGRLQRKEGFMTEHDIKDQSSVYFDNSLDHWCDTTKLAEHFEHKKELKGKKLPKHLVKKMIERKRTVKERMRKQGAAWLSQ